MCTYCGKWFEPNTIMNPLFEEGKTHVLYYCEKCVPEVKSNLYDLHFGHLFTWGGKDIIKRPHIKAEA